MEDYLRIATKRFKARLASLLLEELDISQTERLLDDCIKEILSTQAEEKVEDLQARMADFRKIR